MLMDNTAAFLRNREKWNEIRNDVRYKPLLDELSAAYDECCKDKDIPLLKYSVEMEYFKNGNRKNFERPYFLRRRQLTIYAILSLLYPEKEEYFEKLQDIIAAICTEYSWQVPAHRPAEYRNKHDGHSLFAAETALYLSEIKQVFIDRLDPCIIERISEAVNKKVLESYEGRLTGVEVKNITNNWAPVCAGSIGMAFMYEAPERFYKIRSRIEKCMENYLSGISEDGGTDEGPSYWNYGFGFFMMYYETLRRFTCGREKTAFLNPKVKKLAGFYSDSLLSSKVALSFADASSNSGCYKWLMHFLKKEFGVATPPREKQFIGFSMFSVAIRAFLYYNPDFETDTMPEMERFFDKLGWFVKREKNYSFAAKAGVNFGNHHHNDIGSFIIEKKDEQILCDLGCPEYTAENFGENRYKIINNSSLGHSVPIVFGEAQESGEEYFGTISYDEKLKIDLKNAYKKAPNELIREFEFKQNAVVLTDSFDMGLDIKERFVTTVKPIMFDNKVVIDGVMLKASEGWNYSISAEKSTSHGEEIKERMVYLIDYVPTKPENSFSLTITIN